jgi:arsenate reductase
MKKIKVAFICVHNSCRSQMAEAITKIIACDIFEPFSAGTELKSSINENAVKTIKKLYNYDMNVTQKSKLIHQLPEIDIVVTMGCNVECPFLPCSYREDWGLEDPTGKSEEDFLKTALLIKEKLLILKNKVVSGQIKIQ